MGTGKKDPRKDEGVEICAGKGGANGRIRTVDRRITNAVLYQLSYIGANAVKIMRARRGGVKRKVKSETRKVKR